MPSSSCGDMTKHEAQASWRTPHGPGRYRIWHQQSWRGDYYSVVRLKPSTGASKLNGRPLKFSGYSLKTVVCTWGEAVAIAERDDVQLCGEAP
jgi:hypothetical protein